MDFKRKSTRLWAQADRNINSLRVVAFRIQGRTHENGTFRSLVPKLTSLSARLKSLLLHLIRGRLTPRRRLCLRMAVFPLKRVDSSVDLQRMPLLHSHVNRVTFSLTSTLPMANSGCLCPGHRGGIGGQVGWRCKVIANHMLRRCRPPPIPCFRWRCGGGP